MTQNTDLVGGDSRAPDAGHQRALLLFAAFWIWCAALGYLMLGYNSVEADAGDSNPAAYQAFGLMVYTIAACGLFLPRVIHAWDRFDKLQVGLCAVVLLSVLLQFQGDPATIQLGLVYTVLLLVTTASMSIIWTLPPQDIDRGLVGAALILCSFGVTAIALYGIPDDRNVGGFIQPNMFATPPLAAFILSQFSNRRMMLALRVVCLLLIVAVSSRFALLGCLMALVVFESTYKMMSMRTVALLVVGLMCATMFFDDIVDTLALNDPSRNFDSGFTGRDHEWAFAANYITEHPLGLGFKRAQPADMGHNGFIKTVLEFGLIGGPPILLLVCGIVGRALLAAALRRDGGDVACRFRSARAAGLSALAFGSFFQPQLINLGDAAGIVFLLLLLRPREE